MDFDYLSKIRTTFALQTHKKSSNILEGDFASVYRGRSMEFDELSEYTYGDNVQDIDWKSSSRAGRTLVRRYVADKKHYILFVTDTGPKMLAHTSAGEWKAEISTLALGTIAYLCDRAGADYTVLRTEGQGFRYGLFRSGMPHLDEILRRHAESVGIPSEKDIAAALDFAAEHIRKKMIICLITDIDGVLRLQERLLQKVTDRNDLLVVNIDDAFLTDDNAFDNDFRRYADTYLIRSKRLREAERSQRAALLQAAHKLFLRNRVNMTTVARESEIVDKVLQLFSPRGVM